MARKTTRWRTVRLRAQAVRFGTHLLSFPCAEKAFLGSNLAQRLKESLSSISDQNLPRSPTSTTDDDWPDGAPKLATFDQIALASLHFSAAHLDPPSGNEQCHLSMLSVHLYCSSVDIGSRSLALIIYLSCFHIFLASPYLAAGLL